MSKNSASELDNRIMEIARDIERLPFKDRSPLCAALDRMTSHPAEAATRENGEPKHLPGCPLSHIVPLVLSSCSCGLRDLTTEEVERANAALSAHQQQGGWQPIETAPKDHVRLLLSPGAYEGVTVGFYVNGSWKDDCAQTNSGYSGLIRREDIEPTHWQPLPSPPEPK